MTSHDSGENAVLLTREAKPDDVQAMLELDVYAQSNPGRGAVIREAVDKRQCLVAVELGRLVGYLVLTHDFFENGFISLVVVSPAHQRKGVALQLFAAAQRACKTARLFTSANESNLASRKLIAKAGFVPSGVIENLDEGDSELVYFKFVR
ncbi:GNAT family N-acetyltransferase [Pseudomonas sp. ADAK18]|uniref:GNAT family N-acetyltransferase n=1 Tax=Pseudomonas sp. ADAK18 TaxID=2730848 RepID=UPI00146436DC|nr:GNAT family N-acetyltransferase [Pseudomonas sp. ADAK18]QJI27753.1 GNAT family N-acetyltransferase [Pseudomonas sp. ADAK18]